MDKVVECPELTYEDISDMQGQARFLRAFAYWSLIRTFGPVPLIPEHGLDVSLSYEELSLPRAKFDEIIDFIDNDLKGSLLVLCQEHVPLII
ncbi:RagB/SusD family nutrient uptake outer membrane protein [Bacteroides thetaiotaomicron]|nr:RagB/SusD family nutrient uptake outer membrane protein [Bacteroides thetaiotaomicron]